MYNRPKLLKNVEFVEVDGTKPINEVTTNITNIIEEAIKYGKR